MLNNICNWYSEYLTYTNIRNIAELFYFIVLTGAMVYYAAKSYKKSVEAKPDIITHIYIDYKDRLGEGCISVGTDSGNGVWRYDKDN